MNDKVSPNSFNKLPSGNKNPLMKEFNLSTQAELFATLKQVRFSGQLLLTGPEGSKWTVYLHGGHLLYATGGIHPVKRWYRNILTFVPDPASQSSNWEAELSMSPVNDNNQCWQYQLLCSWIQQGKISREQATKIVWSTLVEIWFDITQAREISYELKQAPSSTERIVLLDGSRVVAEVERKWKTWQKAKLAHYNPDRAPIIKDLERLQQSTSAPVFKMLSQLLSDRKSLRDLALEMQREVLTVTGFLLPYIQSGLVELVNIPDLPAPMFTPSSSNQVEKPLIACVDDSPLICQSLEKFLSAKGYRVVGINDPIRAFSVLIASKPDLIFLDLMMPGTNGYEVCEKLRKIALFRNTPIVILTGNDGVVDRVRAKMVGATDFLSKSKVDAGGVLEVLNKHLRHCTLSQLNIDRTSTLADNRKTA